MTTYAIKASTTEQMSDRQLSFIETLVDERDWDAIENGLERMDRINKLTRIAHDPEEMRPSKAQASEIITWLMSQPRKGHVSNVAGKERAEQPVDKTPSDVRDGYYAIDRPNDNHKNETVFYRLRTGKRGRWQGFQFIDLQAGPAWYPVKGAGARKEVFEAIHAAGQDTARARYGQMIGRCGCCGKPLTDDTSRQIGIGPVCRDK
jgi:hypothetical protein